jgi:hypothetical protein
MTVTKNWRFVFGNAEDQGTADESQSAHRTSCEPTDIDELR